MAKFLTVAAAAALAATTVQAQTPCVPLLFVEQAAGIASLNGVIDILLPSGLLKSGLAAFDPYVITNQTVDAVPFSVLGVDFTLTPVIKTLNLVGVSNISPRHLNATGPSTIDVGVDFPGTLGINATAAFVIEQDKKWWQVCWTNILKPASCPPLTIDVDIGASVENFSVVTNANATMVMCSPAAAAAGTCTDLAVTDILVAALSQDVDALLTRIFNRVAAASLTSVQLAFDKITYLNFHFEKSGSLLTELGKKLLNFTTTELNKKRDVYKAVVDVVGKIAKTLVNSIVKAELAPRFKNTCYDA